MKLKLFTLTLCIIMCITTLVSCSSKYDFQYAFFPFQLENTNPSIFADSSDMNFSYVGDIDQEYVELINEYLNSLTSFVNEKFKLSISKPMPEVKSYVPNYEALASYSEGTIYLYPEGITDDETYGIIHELVHYLSDNNGWVGFIHEVTIEDFSKYVGFGLTEGLTDIITIMYCEENNIPLPQRIIDGTDYYIENRNIANAYYMLEPQVMEWMFSSNHKSMTNFVKSNLNKVANIPSEYSSENIFDLHFYVYQDILMDTMTGTVEDVYTFKLMYTASYEIVAVTVKADSDEVLKEHIYYEFLFYADQDDVIKNIIFK